MENHRQYTGTLIDDLIQTANLADDGQLARIHLVEQLYREYEVAACTVSVAHTEEHQREAKRTWERYETARLATGCEIRE